MNVFELIISPFIFIIKQLFLFSYNITGNYGWAIILLSFAISALLLPIFILIEKAKKKDDAVKRKMKPQLNEIKRCYKGQERYYYLKTLNRQHNYSPLRALIPILSLLLQIPFFIAAYQFLEHFEPMQGVQFWFIKNLAAPDALFGAINILPIAMTLINLLTAYFYTRNGDTSERKQMLIVAGIFLILLFKLPAGLVLYWTMNNVFSFFRMFITNPEVFRKVGKRKSADTISFIKIRINFAQKSSILKKSLITLIIISVLSQLNWATQNSFDSIVIRLISALIGSFVLTVFVWIAIVIADYLKPIVSKIEIPPILYFTLLFLSLYFHFSSQYYFTGTNTTLSVVALLFVLLVQFAGMFYFIRIAKKSNYYVYQIVSFLLITILLSQTIGIKVLLNSGKPTDFHFFNLLYSVSESSYYIVWLQGILFTLLALPFYLKYNRNSFKLLPPIHSATYLLSLIYIDGLVFYWNPLIVYSSFPQNFSFPAINFFSNNFTPFIITIAIGIGLYLITPKKLKYLLQILGLSISIIVFLYSSIIPYDVGTLQVNFFSHEERLAAKAIYYFLEALLLMAVFAGSTWLVKKQLNRKILVALIALNLFLIGQSLFLSFRTDDFFSKKHDIDDNQQETNSYLNKIPFSKTQKNVLYFIIDGAQGWYMHDILKEDSTLLDIYNGFIWYPNTISTSNYTYSSVPSMTSGSGFTIANMNSDDEHTITQKITKSTEVFYNKINDKGYYFTGNSLKYSDVDHGLIDNYLPTWSDTWNSYLDIGFQNEMWYTQLWENALFSGAPLFLKPKIYNKNKWLVNSNIPINSSLLNKYNFIRLLPQISVSDSEKPNFIYIHSMFTHVPWDLISDDNKFVRDVSPYENQQWFTYLFGKWLKWMKENDVYDNTKIILVADHGPSWWHYHKKIEDYDAPIIWTKDKKVSMMEFMRLNSLLMVKDFKSKKPMREDWRLMCNNDAYAIAFDENDPTKVDSASRTITTYYTKWHTDLRTRKKYHNNLVFEVKDYVYDMKNWKKIK